MAARHCFVTLAKVPGLGFFASSVSLRMLGSWFEGSAYVVWGRTGLGFVDGAFLHGSSVAEPLRPVTFEAYAVLVVGDGERQLHFWVCMFCLRMPSFFSDLVMVSLFLSGR